MRFCLFLFFLVIVCSQNYIDYNRVFRIYYDPPERPTKKEDKGAVIELELYDFQAKSYASFRFLIDSVIDAFWVIGRDCQSPVCSDRRKYTPQVNNMWGSVSIELNGGKLSGYITTTHLNLKLFQLPNQPVFVVNSINVNELPTTNIDGVIGISKFFRQYFKQGDYFSVAENILRYNLPQYFILKLGGNEPYMKFGALDFNDTVFYRKDKKSQNYETMQWIKLIEPGKFVFALKHIKLLYRDYWNRITRTEFVSMNCDKGCRAVFDTKSYFIYGPKNQMGKLLSFKTSDCAEETTQPLPDIEFSFYDINVNKYDFTSSATIELTLEPKDFMVGADMPDSGYTCVSGFGDNGNDDTWSFGIMLLKKFLIVYDFRNDSVGFVRTNNDM